MTRFGDEILTSDFPDDDGSADLDLLQALATFESAPGPATRALVVSKLKTARLLVPVVAKVIEKSEDGSDKSSEIQQVHFVSNDGRTATLAFTSIDALKNWDPAARPIPQWARLVAQSAIELGHDAMILDFASSHRIALSATDLREAARPRL